MAEVTAPFDMGEMKADPIRNRIYLIDRSGLRILAFDTAAGQIAAAAELDGSPTIPIPVDGSSLASGRMDISPDGTKLYVALTSARKIQVFALPELVPVITIAVNFEPEGLAAAANGRLYASSTDYWGSIREVETSTGFIVQSFKGGSLDIPFYRHSFVRTNRAGTRLYAVENETSGPGSIFEYDITGPTALPLAMHPFNMASCNDFGVDEQQQRIYTLNGGIYGVEVTDMATGEFGEVWPLGSYGIAVAFLPDDSVIYGASDQIIRKFRRTDGAALGDYAVAHGIPIVRRGVAITPNRNLFYIKKDFVGSGGFNGYICHAGIIGRSSLTISNAPSVGGAANLSLRAMQFTDPEGNGDGIANPGEIVSFAPSFNNVGGQSATNVTVDLVGEPNAVILPPASQSLGSIPAASSATCAPFRVQLAQTLAHRSTITLTLTAHWGAGQSKSFSYAVLVRHEDTPHVTEAFHRGTQFGFSFDALGGETYRLEYKNNLTDPVWQQVDGLSDSAYDTSGPAEIFDPTGYYPGHSKRCYRLRLIP